MGHLHIAGRKMSKSLKNFISISEYLRCGLTTHPADDFRIFCLQHKYSANLTYSEDRIYEAEKFRIRVQKLLSTINNIEQAVNYNQILSRKPSVASIKLTQTINDTKEAILSSLADDFDTPTALKLLIDLITETTAYALEFERRLTANPVVALTDPIEPLHTVKEYIIELLGKFGLQFIGSVPNPMVKVDPLTAQNNFENQVNTVIGFRSNVRNATLTNSKIVKDAIKDVKNFPDSPEKERLLLQLQESKEANDKILQACDQARTTFNEAFQITIEDIGKTMSKWNPK